MPRQPRSPAPQPQPQLQPQPQPQPQPQLQPQPQPPRDRVRPKRKKRAAPRPQAGTAGWDRPAGSAAPTRTVRVMPGHSRRAHGLHPDLALALENGLDPFGRAAAGHDPLAQSDHSSEDERDVARREAQESMTRCGLLLRGAGRVLFGGVADASAIALLIYSLELHSHYHGLIAAGALMIAQLVVLLQLMLYWSDKFDEDISRWSWRHARTVDPDDAESNSAMNATAELSNEELRARERNRKWPRWLHCCRRKAAESDIEAGNVKISDSAVQAEADGSAGPSKQPGRNSLTSMRKHVRLFCAALKTGIRYLRRALALLLMSMYFEVMFASFWACTAPPLTQRRRLNAKIDEIGKAKENSAAEAAPAGDATQGKKGDAAKAKNTQASSKAKRSRHRNNKRKKPTKRRNCCGAVARQRSRARKAIAKRAEAAVRPLPAFVAEYEARAGALRAGFFPFRVALLLWLLQNNHSAVQPTMAPTPLPTPWPTTPPPTPSPSPAPSPPQITRVSVLHPRLGPYDISCFSDDLSVSPALAFRFDCMAPYWEAFLALKDTLTPKFTPKDIYIYGRNINVAKCISCCREAGLPTVDGPGSDTDQCWRGDMIRETCCREYHIWTSSNRGPQTFARDDDCWGDPPTVILDTQNVPGLVNVGAPVGDGAIWRGAVSSTTGAAYRPMCDAPFNYEGTGFVRAFDAQAARHAFVRDLDKFQAGTGPDPGKSPPLSTFTGSHCISCCDEYLHGLGGDPRCWAASSPLAGKGSAAKCCRKLAIPVGQGLITPSPTPWVDQEHQAATAVAAQKARSAATKAYYKEQNAMSHAVFLEKKLQFEKEPRSVFCPLDAPCVSPYFSILAIVVALAALAPLDPVGALMSFVRKRNAEFDPFKIGTWRREATRQHVQAGLRFGNARIAAAVRHVRWKFVTAMTCIAAAVRTHCCSRRARKAKPSTDDSDTKNNVAKRRVVKVTPADTPERAQSTSPKPSPSRHRMDVGVPSGAVVVRAKPLERDDVYDVLNRVFDVGSGLGYEARSRNRELILRAQAEAKSRVLREMRAKERRRAHAEREVLRSQGLTEKEINQKLLEQQGRTSAKARAAAEAAAAEQMQSAANEAARKAAIMAAVDMVSGVVQLRLRSCLLGDRNFEYKVRHLEQDVGARLSQSKSGMSDAKEKSEGPKLGPNRFSAGAAKRANTRRIRAISAFAQSLCALGPLPPPAPFRTGLDIRSLMGWSPWLLELDLRGTILGATGKRQLAGALLRRVAGGVHGDAQSDAKDTHELVAGEESDQDDGNDSDDEASKMTQASLSARVRFHAFFCDDWFIPPDTKHFRLGATYARKLDKITAEQEAFDVEVGAARVLDDNSGDDEPDIEADAVESGFDGTGADTATVASGSVEQPSELPAPPGVADALLAIAVLAHYVGGDVEVVDFSDCAMCGVYAKHLAPPRAMAAKALRRAAASKRRAVIARNDPTAFALGLNKQDVGTVNVRKGRRSKFAQKAAAKLAKQAKAGKNPEQEDHPAGNNITSGAASEDALADALSMGNRIRFEVAGRYELTAVGAVDVLLWGGGDSGGRGTTPEGGNSSAAGRLGAGGGVRCKGLPQLRRLVLRRVGLCGVVGLRPPPPVLAKSFGDAIDTDDMMIFGDGEADADVEIDTDAAANAPTRGTHSLEGIKELCNALTRAAARNGLVLPGGIDLGANELWSRGATALAHGLRDVASAATRAAASTLDQQGDVSVGGNGHHHHYLGGRSAIRQLLLRANNLTRGNRVHDTGTHVEPAAGYNDFEFEPDGSGVIALTRAVSAVVEVKRGRYTRNMDEPEDALGIRRLDLAHNQLCCRVWTDPAAAARGGVVPVQPGTGARVGAERHMPRRTDGELLWNGHLDLRPARCLGRALRAMARAAGREREALALFGARKHYQSGAGEGARVGTDAAKIMPTQLAYGSEDKRMAPRSLMSLCSRCGISGSEVGADASYNALGDRGLRELLDGLEEDDHWTQSDNDDEAQDVPPTPSDDSGSDGPLPVRLDQYSSESGDDYVEGGVPYKLAETRQERAVYHVRSAIAGWDGESAPAPTLSQADKNDRPRRSQLRKRAKRRHNLRRASVAHAAVEAAVPRASLGLTLVGNGINNRGASAMAHFLSGPCGALFEPIHPDAPLSKSSSVRAASKAVSLTPPAYLHAVDLSRNFIGGHGTDKLCEAHTYAIRPSKGARCKVCTFALSSAEHVASCGGAGACVDDTSFGPQATPSLSVLSLAHNPVSGTHGDKPDSLVRLVGTTFGMDQHQLRQVARKNCQFLSPADAQAALDLRENLAAQRPRALQALQGISLRGVSFSRRWRGDHWRGDDDVLRSLARALDHTMCDLTKLTANRGDSDIEEVLDEARVAPGSEGSEGDSQQHDDEFDAGAEFARSFDASFKTVEEIEAEAEAEARAAAEAKAAEEERAAAEARAKRAVRVPLLFADFRQCDTLGCMLALVPWRRDAGGVEDVFIPSPMDVVAADHRHFNKSETDVAGPGGKLLALGEGDESKGLASKDCLAAARELAAVMAKQAQYAHALRQRRWLDGEVVDDDGDEEHGSTCDGPRKRCAMLLLDGNALSRSVLEEIRSHCGVRTPGPNEGANEADRFRSLLHRHHAQRQRHLRWVQLSAAKEGTGEWSGGATGTGTGKTAGTAQGSAVGTIKALLGDALDKAGDVGARGAIAVMHQAAKHRHH